MWTAANKLPVPCILALRTQGLGRGLPTSSARDSEFGPPSTARSLARNARPLHAKIRLPVAVNCLHSWVAPNRGIAFQQSLSEHLEAVVGS